jgi:hypothetical protein
MQLRFQLTDTTTSALAALRQGIGETHRRDFMEVMGRTAQNTLQSHFRAKNQQPNRRGWPKQQFWARIRTATSYDPAKTTDSQAVVAISDPAFAAKVHGATIFPKRAKALAIPLQPLAAQAMPKSGHIAGLQIIKIKGNTYLGTITGKQETLSKTQRNRKRAVKSGIRLYYILKKSVRTPADPTALPPAGTMDTALLSAADMFIRRLTP